MMGWGFATKKSGFFVDDFSSLHCIKFSFSHFSCRFSVMTDHGGKWMGACLRTERWLDWLTFFTFVVIYCDGAGSPSRIAFTSLRFSAAFIVLATCTIEACYV